MILKLKKQVQNFLILTLIPISLISCAPIMIGGGVLVSIKILNTQPLSTTISDATISTKLQAKLISEHIGDLYYRIRISVIDGRVFLTGIVKDPKRAKFAVNAAKEINGVIEVIDEIIIDRNSRLLEKNQIAFDTMLTSQIKTALLLDKDTVFGNFAIITIRNIVYIFGATDSQEKIQKVADVASSFLGVRKVVMHVRLKKDLYQYKNDNSKLRTTKRDPRTKVQTTDINKINIKQFNDW